MRKSITALVLALSPLTSLAEPPSDQSLMELFTLLKAESVMDAVYSAYEPMMRQSLASAAGPTMTDEEKSRLDLMLRRMTEVTRAELSWAQLLPMQMEIYRQSFDQTEVDGLITFYKSPVGQSFINKMPVVTQRAMAAMQVHMQQAMPRIKAAIDRVIEETKAPAPK